MENNNNLVIILGFYDGGSFVDHLLEKKYNIVGVDASEEMISFSKEKYKNFDNLILLNKCVDKSDDKLIEFYISKSPVWNSVHKDIANRLNYYKTTKMVETITLPTLFDKYGYPIYLQMDIEGNDELALRQLLTTKYRPKYISCEIECLGEDHKYSYDKNDGLTNLNILHELGYTKFYLYNCRYDWNTNNIDHIKYIFNNENNWLSYEDIKNKIKILRSDFCDKVKANQHKYYDFWYDIYAKYE